MQMFVRRVIVGKIALVLEFSMRATLLKFASQYPTKSGMPLVGRFQNAVSGVPDTNLEQGSHELVDSQIESKMIKTS